MILDKIENAAIYSSINERIAKGLEYIKSTDLLAMEPGKFQLDDNIKAIVEEYNTKNEEDAKLEAHYNVIDIQYIIKGEELIGYTPLQGQTPWIPYNEEKDVVFYKEEVSYTKLEAGMFAIYFPTDLHRPKVKVGESASVKKLILKIKVN